MKYIAEILKHINQEENTIYRGHANCEWVLKPSIGRHFSDDWSDVIELEIRALTEFKKKAIPYLRYQPKADIEWLCLMQHHGLSTRLLDFTTNPLIALFFATDPAEKHDGELIIATYGRSYENVNDEKLFDRTNSFAYHPPHITERIIGQQGCFVYSNIPNRPLNNKQITKVIVKQNQKFRIRKELATLGISNSLLFPSIDGVCLDINDRLVAELVDRELPF